MRLTWEDFPPLAGRRLAVTLSFLRLEGRKEKDEEEQVEVKRLPQMSQAPKGNKWKQWGHLER